jgi:hypothetical protein
MLGQGCSLGVMECEDRPCLFVVDLGTNLRKIDLRTGRVETSQRVLPEMIWFVKVNPGAGKLFTSTDRGHLKQWAFF